MIINTASIGAYPRFAQARERLEHKIGKPPAAAYAMLQTLRHDDPVRICFDNTTMQTSLFFLGQLDLSAGRLRAGTTQPH